MKVTREQLLFMMQYLLMGVIGLCSWPAMAMSEWHQRADQLHLSAQPEWLNLLHVRAGESEIDDPAFFLSSVGKQNAAAELHATLTALITDQTDSKDSIYCRFPARSRWLIQQMPALAEQIQLPACTELHQLYKQLDAASVTLVYAAAHINSPASAFGHTFLRINSSLGTPLSAYAVNYAAQTDETNGIIYAYQGLFGGYEGRYSMMLYSEKIKEYSELEQRDLWEYQLNLKPDELSRLIDHVIELQPVYADYYFASENCSYNLLWLLQTARPDAPLVDQFSGVVTPIDTIRVIEQQHYIDEEIYRPSTRRRMAKLAQLLDLQDQTLFIPKTAGQYDFALLQGLSVEAQISKLELTVYDLKRQYSQHKVSDDGYKRNLLLLLKERSAIADTVSMPVEAPVSPLAGHRTSRVSLGIQQRYPEYDTSLSVAGRLAYHDVNDLEDGQIPGAFINFFNTELTLDKQKLRVEKWLPVDIHSYALGDTLAHPMSWQVDFGVRRIFEDKAYTYVRTGTGYAVGQSDFYGFMMASAGMYKKNRHETLGSGMLDVGLVIHHRQMKWGVAASQEWFGQQQTEQIQRLFNTYQLSKDWAVNTQLMRRKRTHTADDRTVEVRLFYYF